MNRIALIVLVGACAPASADIAYNTFSANFGYEFLAGSTISGANAQPGYTDTANRFISLATGAITDIWIPVAHNGGPNIFQIQLMSDNANQPGTVLESWTLVNQAFPFVPMYQDPIHMTLLSNTVLQQGTPYWLNLVAGDANSWLVWDFTRPPIFETVAQRFAPNGPWNVLNPGFTSAYRIDVVPEPATVAALVLLAGIAGRRRNTLNW